MSDHKSATEVSGADTQDALVEKIRILWDKLPEKRKEKLTVELLRTTRLGRDAIRGAFPTLPVHVREKYFGHV